MEGRVDPRSGVVHNGNRKSLVPVASHVGFLSLEKGGKASHFVYKPSVQA